MEVAAGFFPQIDHNIPEIYPKGTPMLPGVLGGHSGDPDKVQTPYVGFSTYRTYIRRDPPKRNGEFVPPLGLGGPYREPNLYVKAQQSMHR